jgi:hypothetical protein
MMNNPLAAPTAAWFHAECMAWSRPTFVEFGTM